jgi:hypothetical protein
LRQVERGERRRTAEEEETPDDEHLEDERGDEFFGWMRGLEGFSKGVCCVKVCSYYSEKSKGIGFDTTLLHLITWEVCVNILSASPTFLLPHFHVLFFAVKSSIVM